MGKGDLRICPLARRMSSRCRRVVLHSLSTTLAVLHSLPTPDSELPLDNAFQPAADDSSDAQHSEVEWEIVDDDLAV